MNRDLRASTEQDSSFVDGLERRLERSESYFGAMGARGQLEWDEQRVWMQKAERSFTERKETG